MKKATLLLLIFSFVFVPFLMANGGQEEAAAISDWTKDEITMKIEGSGWILKKFPIQEAADRFMADHPNVTIEVSSNQDDSLNNYMLNWATGDSDVDLAFGGSANQVAKLAAKNLLMPWNDFYSGDFDKKNFLTHSVETANKGGEYFAIPFMEEAMSLIEPSKNAKDIYLNPCFSKEQPFIFVDAQRKPGGYWFVDFKQGRAFWSSGTIPGGFGRLVRKV